jgi:hypothetical protein
MMNHRLPSPGGLAVQRNYRIAASAVHPNAKMENGATHMEHFFSLARIIQESTQSELDSYLPIALKVCRLSRGDLDPTERRMRFLAGRIASIRSKSLAHWYFYSYN